MNQKEAVRQALVNVCGEQEVYTPDKEQKAQVKAILFEGFKAGTIDIKKEKNDSDLKEYVSGLLSNWLRKDTEINGGIKYFPKNPGSRQGNSDPSLKAMRVLLAQVKTDEERAEVQGYIDARLAEIQASKPAKAIDYSALPAELQRLVK